MTFTMCFPSQRSAVAFLCCPFALPAACKFSSLKSCFGLDFLFAGFLEGNKKADGFLISICLCIGYSLFGSSSLSTKGKRRFYICVLVQRKIAVWVAKKPDIIGLFAGDIFFVSTLWSECRDSNSRPLEPHSSAIPNFATPGYFIFASSESNQLVYNTTGRGKCQHIFSEKTIFSSFVFIDKAFPLW